MDAGMDSEFDDKTVRNWTMPIGCLAQLNGDAATLTISEPAVCD